MNTVTLNTMHHSPLLNPFQERPSECVRYWIFADKELLRDYVGKQIFQKAGRQVPIFSYFSDLFLFIPIFPEKLLFFLFFQKS